MAIENAFLTELRKQKKDKKSDVERDESGGIRLGEYQISLEMWKTWAAAAGLPGAKWQDKAAYQRVAAYAARTLYEEFGNWSLVAIGWKYGPGVAQKFRSIYGNSPASGVVETALGKAGAKFVDSMLNAMYKANDRQDGSMPAPPPPAPGGSVEVKFTPETDESEPEQRQTATARIGLINVLTSMANKTAGGERRRIDELETQTVPEVEKGVEPKTPPAQGISEEDTRIG